MKILVVGSGGREHALCWKLARSPACEEIYCAPGNGGIAAAAKIVAIPADDIEALATFARERRIDLTVVGPEKALADGIVDRFNALGLRIFGPTKEAARLESSKVFAKELMAQAGVPTADFKIFAESDQALAYVKEARRPLVVKADGLCAGKGVVVAKTAREAEEAVRAMMIDKEFGPAGDRIVVEECLAGEEASIIVMTDGNRIAELPSCQDHKRAYDHDTGPNTGGMGAYSPAPAVTEEIYRLVVAKAIKPVLEALAGRGIVYRGALYAGVMLTADGPKVLEYNVRFGDPETQALLPRLTSDLLEAMVACADGRLEPASLMWDPRPCVSVVVASGGYPGSYEKDKEIGGLESVAGMSDVFVFHAGTRLGRRSKDAKDMLLTSGGRVLNVTALGRDIRSAIDLSYEAVAKICFDRMHYRRDIGYRALVRP